MPSEVPLATVVQELAPRTRCLTVQPSQQTLQQTQQTIQQAQNGAQQAQQQARTATAGMFELAGTLSPDQWAQVQQDPSILRLIQSD